MVNRRKDVERLYTYQGNSDYEKYLIIARNHKEAHYKLCQELMAKAIRNPGFFVKKYMQDSLGVIITDLGVEQ
jgi:hypothetical protein